MEGDGTLNIGVVYIDRWLGYSNQLTLAINLFKEGKVDLICLLGGRKKDEDLALGVCCAHEIPLGRVKMTNQSDLNGFLNTFIEGVHRIVIVTDWYVLPFD